MFRETYPITFRKAHPEENTKGVCMPGLTRKTKDSLGRMVDKSVAFKYLKGSRNRLHFLKKQPQQYFCSHGLFLNFIPPPSGSRAHFPTLERGQAFATALLEGMCRQQCCVTPEVDPEESVHLYTFCLAHPENLAAMSWGSPAHQRLVTDKFIADQPQLRS